MMLEAIACLDCLYRALILLVIANGAPVVADLVFQQFYANPIDAGLKLGDGRPLFGATKTWRGLLISIGLTAPAAELLGMESLTGAWFALLTMTGDLSSSFLKRRLGLSESSRARGVDTIPESLLPTSLLKEALGLGWIDIMLVAFGFLLIEESVSPLLYRLNIRKRPY